MTLGQFLRDHKIIDPKNPIWSYRLFPPESLEDDMVLHLMILYGKNKRESKQPGNLVEKKIVFEITQVLDVGTDKVTFVNW